MLAKLASGASRTALDNGVLMMLAFSHKRRVLAVSLPCRLLPGAGVEASLLLHRAHSGVPMQTIVLFIPGIPDSSSQPQAQPKVPAAIFDPVRA
mmetsp:Transcript_5936/g.13604  ORF Transcript_5936/g.13604 Transcript_5936/m.13604 type:complete len:94 (+) Transcript_5936:2076-2357(+)